jgi:cobalamin-dependent methionine synthase I
VHTITEETRKDVVGKMTMLVCSPAGEQHNLGCRIIESVLLSKGYQVLNVSPSAPSDSIIRYIKDADPHMIFISVTLPENLGSAARLMRAIRKVSIKPVFIGGQAVNSHSAADRKKSLSSINGVHVLENVRLDEVMRIVKKIK